MRALIQCLCVFAVLLVVSCTDEASEIGSNFFEGGSLNMAAVDTLSVKVSTVKFDSMITGNLSRYLLGYHEDADLGKITATPFFQMGIPIAPLSIDKLYTTYTRSEMLLIQDGYSVYDTTALVTFSVHKVTQEITRGTDYFYNTANFKYDETPLGTVTFRPRPNAKDTVKITLTDDLGRAIVDFAQSSAKQVSTADEFINYFDGFVLVPATNSAAIVGFSTTAYMRVYYTDKSQTPSKEKYLTLSSGEYSQFNNMKSDVSDTKLAALTQRRWPLSSTETDNKAYIQSGVGLGMRISIPYLRSILLDNPNITVVNAQLEFSPTRDNDDDGINVKLPTQMALSAVDYQNTIVNTYATEPFLIEDVYLGRDTHYVVDITTYVNAQLATEEFNDNGILFTPYDATFRGTFDRLYIGDQFNERKMKVTLTCLNYQTK